VRNVLDRVLLMHAFMDACMSELVDGQRIEWICCSLSSVEWRVCVYI
jgi:hypothetical protein